MTPEHGDAAAAGRPGGELASLTLAVTTLWIAALPALSGIGIRLLDPLPLLTFERAGFLLVASLLLAVIVREPRRLLPLNGAEKAMGVYLAIVLGSWLTTLAAKDAVTLEQDADFLLTCFLMPFVAYGVARSVRWTPARLVGCIGALVAIGGGHLIFVGLVQGTVDWSSLVAEGAEKVHRDRAKGPFPNAVLFGIVLSVLLPMSLFLYLQARRRVARVAALGLVVGLVEVIVFSKARAVWAGVAVAMLFAARRCPRLRWPAAVIGGALLAQVALASLAVVWRGDSGTGIPFLRGMLERVTEIEPIFNRVAVYTTDLHMIAARPLTGFGFGLSTFEDHRADYYTSCCGVPVHYAAACVVPHNEVLNQLIQLGVFGLLAYLVLAGCVWRLLAAARSDGPAGSARATLALCAQAAFVTLLLVGQAHDLMYLGYVLLLFLFFVGIVAGSEASPPAAQAEAP